METDKPSRRDLFHIVGSAPVLAAVTAEVAAAQGHDAHPAP